MSTAPFASLGQDLDVLDQSRQLASKSAIMACNINLSGLSKCLPFSLFPACARLPLLRYSYLDSPRCCSRFFFPSSLLLLRNPSRPFRELSMPPTKVGATARTPLAQPSNGTMEVFYNSYIQGVADRILFPVNLTNVVARINGTEDSNRAYVVTGHYDSRRIDISDYRNDAPGADDDASGVAGIINPFPRSRPLL